MLLAHCLGSSNELCICVNEATDRLDTTDQLQTRWLAIPTTFTTKHLVNVPGAIQVEISDSSGNSPQAAPTMLRLSGDSILIFLCVNYYPG